MMPIVVLRPTSASGTGWTNVGGAASLGASQADDNDDTYARSPAIPTTSGPFTASMTDVVAQPSLPTGTKVVAIRLRYRGSGDGPGIVSAGAEGLVPVRYRLGISGLASWHTYDTNHHNRSYAPFTPVNEHAFAWEASRPGGGVWTVADVNAIRVLASGRGSSDLSGSSDTHAQVVEVFVEVDYNERPTATYIGPTGVVADTSQPTITWDYADPEGDPQSSFRVIVTYGGGPNDGQVAYDSGWVLSSATSHQVGTLNNDQAYTASVQVRQVWSGLGNHESLVDTGTFSLDLDAPDAPTLTLTPDPDNARMVVEVDDPSVSPTPAAEWMVVEFSDEGPSGPWTLLRGAGEVLPPYPVTLHDYEVRFNQERWYRARSFYDASGLAIGSNATVDSDEVVVTNVVVWITDPLDPSDIHMKVEPTAERERTWRGREIVHTPADMDIHVVESEVATRSDSISFLAVDSAAHDSLVKLFDSTRTLLYRDDRREHFYFRWAGDRGRRQVGGRRLDADIFTASQVIVGRPSS